MPLALLVFAGGCTIIKIEGASSRTRIVPGVVRVQAAGPQSILVVRATGLGIVPQSRGAVLGFASETAAYMPAEQRCAIILFQPAPSHAAAVIDALKAGGVPGDAICTVAK